MANYTFVGDVSTFLRVVPVATARFNAALFRFRAVEEGCTAKTVKVLYEERCYAKMLFRRPGKTTACCYSLERQCPLTICSYVERISGHVQCVWGDIET